MIFNRRTSKNTIFQRLKNTVPIFSRRVRFNPHPIILEEEEDKNERKNDLVKHKQRR